MQGVIKAYDPDTGLGVVMCDTDLADYDLAANALEGSIFRMLRQGQRVIFDLDDAGRATHLRLGSEVDMGTPGVTERSSIRSSANAFSASSPLTICFSDLHICTNSLVRAFRTLTPRGTDAADW